MYYTSFLPDYSVGEDCYDAVPKIAKQYGKTAVVIGGKTAMSKAKPYLDEAVKDMEVGQIIDIHLMPEEAYGMPDPENGVRFGSPLRGLPEYGSAGFC